MSASEICEQLIQKLRQSNLNFVLTESPFSVEIKIKKSFVKIHNQSSPNPKKYNTNSGYYTTPTEKVLKFKTTPSNTQNLYSSSSPSPPNMYTSSNKVNTYSQKRTNVISG